MGMSAGSLEGDVGRSLGNTFSDCSSFLSELRSRVSSQEQAGREVVGGVRGEVKTQNSFVAEWGSERTREVERLARQHKVLVRHEVSVILSPRVVCFSPSATPVWLKPPSPVSHSLVPEGGSGGLPSVPAGAVELNEEQGAWERF